MWIILDYRSVMEIKGPDRKIFLQGLVTQDVMKLSSGGALYGLLLTNTGRFFCDFFMVEDNDSIFLTPGTASLPSLLKKLSFYKLRSAVDFLTHSDWGVAVSIDTYRAPRGPGVVFQDPRLAALGPLFVGPLSSLEDTTTDKTHYETNRLGLGVPEGPLDLEVEKSIPLENWMDELNAISWTKGCFLGQELTARTKHVGEVRKKIFSFFTDGKLSIGDILEGEDEKEIGRVVSSYASGLAGFALVRSEAIPNDRILWGGQNKARVVLRQNWLSS